MSTDQMDLGQETVTLSSYVVHPINLLALTIDDETYS